MQQHVDLTIFSAGYCTQIEATTLRGGRWRPVRYPALFALLEHPHEGYLLFDTGYAPRLVAATSRWPYRLYALATPASVAPAQAAVAQLAQRGIAPTDVRQVILSHFHADHLGGLRDFTEATFVYTAESYAAVRNKRGLAAVRRAFLPDLLPPNFAARSQPLHGDATYALGDDFAPFTHGYDVLGDGSVVAVALPGHAAGQIGLVVTTNVGPVFLVADACWHSSAYRTAQPLPLAAHIVSADSSATSETLRRLRVLHQRRPALPLLPSHCSEVEAQWVAGGDED